MSEIIQMLRSIQSVHKDCSPVLSKACGSAADEIERLTNQIEMLKLDRNMHRSINEEYLAERQEMRNLFPACLDEFGPSLLGAMKQELEARKK